MLAISTAVPGNYQTNTSGLMGNFNNDPNDDFIPRGETNALPANINDSQIFKYGKTCEYQPLGSNKTNHKVGLNKRRPAWLQGVQTSLRLTSTFVIYILESFISKLCSSEISNFLASFCSLTGWKPRR